MQQTSNNTSFTNENASNGVMIKKRGRPRKIRFENATSDMTNALKSKICNEINNVSEYQPLANSNQNQIVAPEEFTLLDHSFPVVKKLDLKDVLTMHQISKLDQCVKKEMQKDSLMLKQHIKNHYTDDEICNILVSYIMENTFQHLTCANQEHLCITYIGKLHNDDPATTENAIAEEKAIKENKPKPSIAMIKSAIIPPRQKLREVISLDSPSKEQDSSHLLEKDVKISQKYQTSLRRKDDPPKQSPEFWKKEGMSFEITSAKAESDHLQKSTPKFSSPKKSNILQQELAASNNPRNNYCQYQPPFQRDAVGSYYYNYPRVFLNTLVNNSCFPQGYIYPKFNMFPYPPMCPPPILNQANSSTLYNSRPSSPKSEHSSLHNKRERQEEDDIKFSSDESSLLGKTGENEKKCDVDDMFSFHNDTEKERDTHSSTNNCQSKCQNPSEPSEGEKKTQRENYISLEESTKFGEKCWESSKKGNKIDEIINVIQQLDREKKMLDVNSLGKLEWLISKSAFSSFKKILFEQGGDSFKNDKVTIELYEDEKFVLRLTYTPKTRIYSISKSKKLWCKRNKGV